MIVQAVVFYLFASVMLLSATAVITLKNPVHSVLCLILAFFNAAGLFLMLGAEFVAMILVIVYVGAVAVLFLFVVMMLDIDFSRLREGVVKYAPIGIVLGVVLLAELLLLFRAVFGEGRFETQAVTDDVTNTQALGQVLYTDYIYIFQSAGLILLVAMIGAIVLTLTHRTGVKRQNVGDQVSRRPEDVLEIHKVEKRTGV